MASIFGISLPKISLPKLDLGAIGKNVLEQGVQILKGVAKDMFTPAKDGKNIFKPEINAKIGPFDIKLKNPVEALAGKLLGKVGEELNKRGFSTEALAGYLNGGGTTNTVPETDIELPSLEDRIATGGGTTPKAATTTAMTTGAAATGGATPAPATTGATLPTSSLDIGSRALDSFSSGLGKLDEQINSALNGGLKKDAEGNYDQLEMIKLQRAMQQRSELFQFLSQVIAMEHQTKQAIIANIR